MKKIIITAALLYLSLLSSAVSADLCPICMHTLQPTTVNQRLCCGHVFHATCLGRWLRNNQACPCCRADAVLHSNRFLRVIHDRCVSNFESAQQSVASPTPLIFPPPIQGIDVTQTLNQLPSSILSNFDSMLDQQRHDYSWGIYHALSNLDLDSADAVLLSILIVAQHLFAGTQ